MATPFVSSLPSPTVQDVDNARAIQQAPFLFRQIDVLRAALQGIESKAAQVRLSDEAAQALANVRQQTNAAITKINGILLDMQAAGQKAVEQGLVYTGRDTTNPNYLPPYLRHVGRKFGPAEDFANQAADDIYNAVGNVFGGWFSIPKAGGLGDGGVSIALAVCVTIVLVASIAGYAWVQDSQARIEEAKALQAAAAANQANYGAYLAAYTAAVQAGQAPPAPPNTVQPANGGSSGSGGFLGDIKGIGMIALLVVGAVVITKLGKSKAG